MNKIYAYARKVAKWVDELETGNFLALLGCIACIAITVLAMVLMSSGVQ